MKHQLTQLKGKCMISVTRLALHYNPYLGTVHFFRGGGGGGEEFFELSLTRCMTPQSLNFFPCPPPPIKVSFFGDPPPPPPSPPKPKKSSIKPALFHFSSWATLFIILVVFPRMLILLSLKDPWELTIEHF